MPSSDGPRLLEATRTVARVRAPSGAPRPRPRGGRRRGAGGGRAQRRRQDHAAPGARRADPARPGRGEARAAGRSAATPPTSAGRSAWCPTSRCSTTISRCTRISPSPRGCTACRRRRRAARAALDEAGLGARAGRVAPAAQPRAGCSAPRSRGRCCTAPGVLLLDEPFTALDAAASERLRAELGARRAQGLGDRAGHPPAGRGVGGGDPDGGAGRRAAGRATKRWPARWRGSSLATRS